MEIVLGVATVFAILVGGSFLSYEGYRYFAPRYQAVDSAVFHESAQYNEGMIRDLENLRMQYTQADETGKAALKATVLHRFSVYPTEKLTPELRNFYVSLRGY